MIYLDNAATTFPKPKEVADSIYDYITKHGSNINRGCYKKAYDTGELVYETRKLLCELFDADNCKNVVFTKNITESINVILKGYLKSGDHILVSAMEHNSVMRPLSQLQKQGVSYSIIPCEADGSIITDAIKPLIQPNTRALLCTHASNVCGTIFPIHEIGKICRDNHIRFIVDSAQTAGILPISMKEMNIDVLAFTGHKGLLGPQGIGGFILNKDMVGEITPLISGGSGSFSDTAEIPPLMPDRFEAGTLNLPGIVGLHSALLWLKETGLINIYNHEMHLTKLFLNRLAKLEKSGKINVIGKKDITNRLGVISIQMASIDIAEAAFILDDKYEIMTRVGIHCAPIAHKTLNTFPTGTLRFSFSYFNCVQDVDDTIKALEEICNGF